MTPSNTHLETAARGLRRAFLLQAASGLLAVLLAAPASALAQGVIQFSAGTSASARYRVNDDGTNLQTLACPQFPNRRIMASTRSDYLGGRQYLYVQQLGNTNNLFAWSEGTGQSKAVTNIQGTLSVYINSGQWSNDGLDSFVSFVVYNSATGQIFNYRAHVSAADITSASYQPVTLSDSRLELVGWQGGFVYYYWWSHDGSRFYYPDPRDRTKIRVKIVGVGVTIDDDPIVFIAPAELVDLRVIPPVNSVSDRYLVAAEAHGAGILGIDLETSTWWWLATPSTLSITGITWGPCFSPDGSTIAFGGTRSITTTTGPGKKKTTTTSYFGVYKVPFFGGPVTRVTEVNSGGDVTVNNWFIP